MILNNVDKFDGVDGHEKAQSDEQTITEVLNSIEPVVDRDVVEVRNVRPKNEESSWDKIGIMVAKLSKSDRSNWLFDRGKFVPSLTTIAAD